MKKENVKIIISEDWGETKEYTCFTPQEDDMAKAKASGQSFDDWVKGQGETLYYGGDLGEAKIRGTFLTPEKKIAQNYAEEYGKTVNEVFIQPNAKKIGVKNSLDAYIKYGDNEGVKKASQYYLDLINPNVKAKEKYAKYVDKFDFINQNKLIRDLEKQYNTKLDLKSVQRETDKFLSQKFKKEGFDVIEHTSPKDVGYTDVSTGNKEFQILNLDKIKTRSQLKAEWDKTKEEKF
jgi:hypothetical protein